MPRQLYEEIRYLKRLISVVPNSCKLEIFQYKTMAMEVFWAVSSNYFLLLRTLKQPTTLKKGFCCGNYSREETIQRRKLLFFQFCQHLTQIKKVFKKINFCCLRLLQSRNISKTRLILAIEVFWAVSSNYFFLLRTLKQPTSLKKGFCCENYSREETIQRRKLFLLFWKHKYWDSTLGTYSATVQQLSVVTRNDPKFSLLSRYKEIHA